MASGINWEWMDETLRMMSTSIDADLLKKGEQFSNCQVRSDLMVFSRHLAETIDSLGYLMRDVEAWRKAVYGTGEGQGLTKPKG